MSSINSVRKLQITKLQLYFNMKNKKIKNLKNGEKRWPDIGIYTYYSRPTSCDKAFLRSQITAKSLYFCKKVPSQIFGRVPGTPLYGLLSEGYAVPWFSQAKHLSLFKKKKKKNLDSPHARLNSYYEAWSYKKKKHKKIRAYRKSVQREPTVERYLLILG